MNGSILVFRNRFAQFKQEKGMLLFYCFIIAIMGIVVPFFRHELISSLTAAALLTAAFLNPILSDSMAGDRERRTLETLLSSPIKGRSVVWGKFLFGLFFALSFFSLTTLCAALTNWLVSRETPLAFWQWLGIILAAILNFGTISIAGLHASAVSADMRTANSRVSFIAYPLGLLFIVYIAVIVSVDFIPALVVSLILAFLYLCVISVFTFKTVRMKQSDYFENIKIKGRKKARTHYASYLAPKSQFGIVFGFELKYLLTFKTVLFQYGFLCFTPAIVAWLSFYYTGKFELNYAAFITVLFIPRIPSSLIALSIGGEKAYKTGESLLSTPLKIRQIFLAKCMIPLTISALMLILSSLFTLMGAEIISRLTPGIAIARGYTVEQLVLIFPVGIMSATLMIFISAILSVAMKTPRAGMNVSSMLTFLFVVPVLAIVYLSHNVLIWSVVYAVVLLICSVICIIKISDKISRPQILDRL